MPDRDCPHTAGARPRLYQIETQLLELRHRQAAFHYALGAFLAQYADLERDDLTLHCESSECLRALDAVREEIGAVRRTLGEAPAFTVGGAS